MRLQIVAVRDSAADMYMQPQFVPTVGVGIRAFTDQINNKDAQNIMNKHPEQFDLYCLGSYDDNTGEFSEGPPKHLIHGKNVVTG